MSSIRIPPKADIDIQNAFRDVEKRLQELSRRTGSGGLSSTDKKEISDLKTAVDRMKPSPDHNEEPRETTFVGPVNFLGEASFPTEPELGFIRNGSDVLDTTAQTVHNLNSSLAIAPGGLSADTVRARELNSYGESTIWREACRVAKTSDLALGALTETDVTFDAEQYDFGGFHSTSSNTDQIVIPRDGLYLIGAWAIFDTGNGSCIVYITNNDPAPSAEAARLVSGRTEISGTNGYVNITCIEELDADDVIRMSVLTSAGNNMYGTAAFGPRANGLYILRVN